MPIVHQMLTFNRLLKRISLIKILPLVMYAIFPSGSIVLVVLQQQLYYTHSLPSWGYPSVKQMINIMITFKNILIVGIIVFRKRKFINGISKVLTFNQHLTFNKINNFSWTQIRPNLCVINIVLLIQPILY